VTDTSLPANRFAERDFRVGRTINDAFSVMTRNFVMFCAVTLVTSLPSVFSTFYQSQLDTESIYIVVLFVLGILLSALLGAVAQASIVYGAFEDMRGRPVNLIESLRIGLRRFFPVLGVALGVAILTALAGILLVIPAFIVATMLLVAMPACVVEQLGPGKSMGRSAQLTKGYRWKIFGLWLLAMVTSGIMQSVLMGLAKIIGGSALALIVFLAWSAIFGAFYAIMVVVTYHDLRVAKEGVDTEQIAAVFD
jgi:MFS family permease